MNTERIKKRLKSVPLTRPELQAGILTAFIRILCLLVLMNAVPANALELTTSTRSLHIGTQLQVLEDREQLYSINQITAAPQTDLFQTSPYADANFGIKFTTYWARFSVRNTSSATDWVLQIAESSLDDVRVYHQNPNGHWQVLQGGELYPRQSDEAFRTPVFHLSLAADQNHVIYLRIHNAGLMKFPPVIYSQAEWEHFKDQDSLINGLFYGFMLALLLHNLFLFISLRDQNYLYFSACMVGYILYTLALDGYGYLYLWGSVTSYLNNVLPLTVRISLIFILQFTKSFLNTPVNSPQLSRFITLMQIVQVTLLALLLIPASVMGPQFWDGLALSVQLATPAALMACLIAGIKVLRKGYLPARFYLAAWVSLFIGSLIAMANVSAWFEIPGWGRMQFSFVVGIHALIFSLGLASRVRMMMGRIENTVEHLQQEVADHRNTTLALQQSNQNYLVELRERRKAETALQLHRDQLEQTVTDRTWELEQASTRAKRANREKTQFLANMSHEIRTPMNAIIGLTQLMKRTHLTAQQADYQQSIETASQNLLSLINKSLDLSKIEAGKLELERVPFQLHELILQQQGIFAEKATQKGLRLEAVPLPEGLPCLSADPLRLGQIITNLLDNAIKFTQQGTITLQANLQQHSDTSGTLTLSVQDTGIGISADQQHRLFNRFSQADGSTTRSYGGTGLGLTISRQLVSMMRGRLTLRSAPGIGSCFEAIMPVVLLPANLPREKTANLAPQPAPQVQDNELNNLSILLVEDNIINQQIARELLRFAGADVTSVDDGESALKALKAEKYDVILMDIQMPDMDGYQVSAALRGRGDTTPIIAVTANVFTDDIQRCLSHGMNGHVGKPITIESMAAEIKRVLCKAPRTGARQPKQLEPQQANLTLNIQRGLANIPSSPELYPELLQLFCDNHHADIQRSLQLFKDGQNHLAQPIMHDLKGVLASIGADRLHRLVEQIDNGLQHEAQELHKQIVIAETEMKNLLKTIRDYLQRDPSNASALPASIRSDP